MCKRHIKLCSQRKNDMGDSKTQVDSKGTKVSLGTEHIQKVITTVWYIAQSLSTKRLTKHLVLSLNLKTHPLDQSCYAVLALSDCTTYCEFPEMQNMCTLNHASSCERICKKRIINSPHSHKFSVLKNSE